MLEKNGGFLSFIPEYVEVQYLESYKNIKSVINDPPKKTLINHVKRGKIIRGITLFFLQQISKLLNDSRILFKYLLRNFPALANEYDLAIAYAGPMDLISYFIIHKIKAKKKVQWIHFDVTKIGFNRKFAAKLYKYFDTIFVVSSEAKNKLIKCIPTIEEKTEVFENIVSNQLIQNQSKINQGFEDNFKGYRILTVGRLSKEKGHDLAIQVCAKLIKDGYQIKWYCIGEGKERKEYEDMIKKYKLKDSFQLLGLKTNPYPFIKQCDIYVQPSRYEGYCLTVMEAKCLNKPIITTNVNGANEQIRTEITGLIVPIDVDEIYTAIKRVLDDNTLCNTFSKNLLKETFEPTVMNKFYNLFEQQKQEKNMNIMNVDIALEVNKKHYF
ncbi:MAG: glycosyltransferase [Heyndrickxia sp.]